MTRSLFFNWSFFKKQTQNKKLILNFGPQHPAAHGVLRLILQLEGEIIQKTDIHIGLLHRGTEFLAETKFYEKTIPYFDRLDYVSMMTQEHAYCLAIEYLQQITNVSKYINYTRILFDELTRIMNHLLAIACHALDVGSMSSIFWSFEEREKLMEFYERVSGARMHAAFHRPVNTFTCVLDKLFLIDILLFVKNCYTTLNEIHNVLTYNKIWKQRLTNIGLLNIQECANWGLTGVMARSCGLKRDLRLSQSDSYSQYNLLKFNSYIGINGDTFDRYLIRMLEMGESLQIINQIALKLMLYVPVHVQSQNIINNLFVYNTYSLNNNYTSMEDLITHFINWHSGTKISKNNTSIYIESPKGEFGVNLISNDSAYPTRCKIRSPSYHHLQFLPKMTKGHYLADLAALIGTIDIVFGEIDR